MNCPKCGAHNDDAAVCCSLCYDTFKAKPKGGSVVAATPSGGTDKIAFPEVSFTYEHWEISGPMVIGLNGLYFFIKEMEYVKESTGKMVGDQIGGVGGFLIGAAIDNASGPPPGRPDKIPFAPARDVLDQCQRVLGDAPDLPSCKEYFGIAKKEIQSLSFGFWGGLTVKASWIELSVSGISPEEKASAYFKLKGFPLES